MIQGAEAFFLPGKSSISKAVLLIHGFTGNPAELFLLGEFLSERGYTVLAVRLAGHGTSEEDLLRFHIEDWQNSVRDGYAILSGITKDIAVIGASMGGSLAFLLATEKEVTSLVSLAAPIFIAPEKGLEQLPPKEKLTPQDSVPKARRNFKEVPAVNKVYRKMPLLSVYDLLEVIDKSKAALPRVKVPTLILHGYADHTADIKSANYIYEHIGSEKKEMEIIEGAGHLLPLLDCREAVFQKIAQFLQANG